MTYPEDFSKIQKLLINITSFVALGLIIAFLCGVVALSQQFYLVNLFAVGVLISGYYAFEYAINGGGSLWNCLKEDFKMYGVNGSEYRTNYIKEQFQKMPNLTIGGRKQTWSMIDKQFTEQDYSDCANDVLGTGLYFWITKLVIPLGIVAFVTQRHFLIF